MPLCVEQAIAQRVEMMTHESATAHVDPAFNSSSAILRHHLQLFIALNDELTQDNPPILRSPQVSVGAGHNALRARDC